MASFKCNNCGKEQDVSERITDNSPESVNKLVGIISALMIVLGNGGPGKFFRDGNVCKGCKMQIYVFIGFILLFIILLISGFLSSFNTN